MNNHALRLAEAGRRPEALTFSQEAVTLRRELAAGNPDAYLPNLARGLWGYAWVRNLLGTELAVGLAAAEESVDLYTQLTNAEPSAFKKALAGAHDTQASILEALGRDDEADEVRKLLRNNDNDQE